MSTLLIKHTCLFLMLALFLGSCIKADTDPKLLFHQVEKEIAQLTGQNIYWNEALHNSIIPISIDELLQRELTDDFAVQIALLNNQNLQATYESLGIAKADLAQAGLLKNPIFFFEYQFSTQPIFTAIINMSLLQNFLEILLIPLKKKMAQAELEATLAEVTAQALEVIAETKIAFYQLQAAEQIWSLKKESLLAAELSYEAAKKLHEVGNLIDLQVVTERSFYEAEKLEVASWEVAVLEAREKLNKLMGLWGCQINWRLSSDLPIIPKEVGEFRNVENDAIIKSLDLKVLHSKLLATAARFGMDTTKLVFPQFDMGPSIQREESVWYIGPAFNLPVPLFDWGKVNSAKAKAKILQEWNRYTALAIEIRSKARSFRFSLLNAFRQSRYLDQVIVPLAKQATHFTLLQHNAMQLGVFDLLSTKRVELEKKIQSVRMQKEYWTSRVVLETLLNGHILGHRLFKASFRKQDEPVW